MSQITLKTSASAEQTASSSLASAVAGGFGVITLLAIALFGWANPVLQPWITGPTCCRAARSC